MAKTGFRGITVPDRVHEQLEQIRGDRKLTSISKVIAELADEALQVGEASA